jgi:hypothetical protein
MGDLPHCGGGWVLSERGFPVISPDFLLSKSWCSFTNRYDFITSGMFVRYDVAESLSGSASSRGSSIARKQKERHLSPVHGTKIALMAHSVWYARKQIAAGSSRRD